MYAHFRNLIAEISNILKNSNTVIDKDVALLELIQNFSSNK